MTRPSRSDVPAAILVVLGALAIGCQSLPSKSGSPSGSASGSPGPTPAATDPGPAVACTAEPGPLPSVLAGDPCAGAVLAVELAVAPVRLPITRLAIEPGPFYCDVIWPGVGTPPACYGPIVRPGQFMHAWVAFRGSDAVAAVMLGLNLPDDLDQPGATRPPWSATLAEVEVPPIGWVMP